MAKLAGTGSGNVLKGTAGADTIDALAGNDTVSGLAGNDLLDGGAGNDTLDGGSGADSMAGGAGNDSFYVDSLADRVSETAAGSAGGIDIVYSSVAFTLGANLENLRLYKAAASGAGNALANHIEGSGTANVLAGLDGNDTLVGGGGNDSLLGAYGSDRLQGDAGNDSLDGGAGDDRMAGGAGNDSYYVNVTGDSVLETAAGSAGGTDIVYSAVAFTLGANLENLRLYKAAASGTGNAIANHLEGSGTANTLAGLDGNDTLLGGDGADKLLGGTGNDVLAGTLMSKVVDTDSDSYTPPGFGGDTLDGGAGSDTAVFADIRAFAFRAGWTESPDIAINLGTGKASYAGLNAKADVLVSVENVRAGGGDDTITGTDGDNRIDAGGGANVVHGGGGADTIIFGSTSSEDVSLGAGDYLGRAYGGAGDDVLRGNGAMLNYSSGDGSPATDYLSGGGGDDDISQGDGSAVMHGGAGADTFRAKAHAWEMTAGGPGVASVIVSEATIKDFDPAEGDRIVFAGNADLPEGSDYVVPSFVGTATPGLNEVGYAKDGDSTVVTYVFATDAMGYDDAGDPMTSLAFTLTLEAFAGKLLASDFDFV